MKFFGLILILAVASSQASLDVKRAKRSAINSGLLALVEQIREIMLTGNDTLGIPVLDPFETETLDFDIDNDSATLAGSLTDVKATGLAGFTADTLTFTVIGIKFTYCFNWEKITVSSGYTVDGTVMSVIPIYGTGDLDVELGDLNVCGTLALSSSGGYLYIRTSTVTIALGDFAMKATGLLNNDELSALISAVASDVVPQLVTDFETQISEVVNNVIISFGNELLGTMTLAELIALITG